MKKKQAFFLSVIVIFALYSILVYQNSLTTYVNFAQAKNTKNAVQVKGTLTAPKITQTEDGRSITFVLRDDNGEEVTVNYHGIKPNGLEQASGIVAVGKYANGQFQADKLLVKCPSKYQGSVNQ